MTKTFREIREEVDVDIREPLMVSVSELKGVPRLDLRHFYETKEGVLVPGRKGINVEMTEANYRTLYAAIEAAEIPADNIERVQELDIAVSQTLLFRVSNFKNEWRIDIRHHYWKGGDPLPTKRGINLALSGRDGLLAALENLYEKSQAA